MKTSALTLSAGALLAIIVGAAVFADWLPLRDPLAQDAARRLLGPGGEGGLFGSDNFGRDLFSRLVYGARSSLYIAFGSVGLATALGGLIGTASAYKGGWADLAVQRATDALLGFPILVLALVLIVALGPSSHAVMAAIAIGVTPQMIRLARSRVLSTMEEPFIAAARAMGLPPHRIMLKRLLPRTFSPLLAYATGYIGIALVIESALHFLGLGVPPPVPSWGGVLQEGWPYMESARWLAVFPGLVLSVCAFGFIFLGDAVRDRLDPRARQGV